MFPCIRRHQRHVEGQLAIIKAEIRAMANRMDQVLEEVRQSKTVADGMAAALRAERQLVTELRQQLADAGADTAKVDEIIALNDRLQSDGMAAIAEGTDGTFSPSTN